MPIIFDFPAWWILFCFLASILFAGILYYKNSNDAFSKKLKILLFSLRFLSIFIISVLLLNPIIKLKQKQNQNPSIYILSDNSQSIGLWSKKMAPQLKTDVVELLEKLKKEFDCEDYDFGDSLSTHASYNYTHSSTDISAAISASLAHSHGKNLAGIVLLSDGIVNQGLDPLLLIPEIPIPIFCIGLGDSSKKSDLKIVQLNANPTASKNTNFPFEISVSAQSCEAKKSEIKVWVNNQLIHSENILVNQAEFSKTILLQHKILKSGINKIRAEWKPLEIEENKQNNIKEFYFNVIEDKKTIQIVYNSPHPDINAIKEALMGNPENEVLSTSVTNFSAAKRCDLLILHQLPSNTNNASNVITFAQKEGIPILWILGTQSNINAFNQINSGIKMGGAKSGFTEMQGTLNENFSSYKPDNYLSNEIKQMPALMVPFGNYEQTPAVKTLVWQRLGKVTSTLPLIATLEGNDQTNGIVVGEGLWKWRINTFQRNKSHEAFDQFFSQFCRYLLQQKKQSRFRIIYNSLALSNRKYTLAAELLNNNNELFNSPDVEIIINDQDHKKYRFVFSKDQNSYFLDLGKLPAGEYSFEAKVLNKDFPFTQAGKWVITDENPELLNLTADFALLKELSKQSGGIFIPYDQINKASEMIKSKTDNKRTYSVFYSYLDLISWTWILLLVVFLLTTEWVIRKREGLY